MLRKGAPLFAVALVHFAVTFLLLATSFSLGMERFDTGAAPGLLEYILSSVGTLSYYPIALPLLDITGVRGFPAEHLIFFVNSLFWAWGLLWLIRYIRNHRVGGQRCA